MQGFNLCHYCLFLLRRRHRIKKHYSTDVSQCREGNEGDIASPDHRKDESSGTAS